ncbi:MAG: GH36-type glycosyl hydrolase domain-containing protein [Christensenellales bacterium]
MQSALILQNAITAIREITKSDWERFFCMASKVEQTLAADPVYRLLDDPSKSYLRGCVRRLARQTKTAEVSVARTAMALAETGEDERCRHACWWITGDGVPALKAALIGSDVHAAIVDSIKQAESTTEKQEQAKTPATRAVARFPRRNSRNFLIFLGITLAVQYAILTLCWIISGSPWAMLLAIPAGVAAWTLAQDVVIRCALKLVPVRRLPRFAFADGIPDKCRTLLTVTALVDSPERAKELVRTLDVHSRACNREKNIYYCLLCDLPEAKSPKTPEDGAIIQAIKEGIAELNKEAQTTLFYALIRPRVQNSQGVYTGHERKRGALMWLNELILSGKGDELPSGIAYVLTLDADTRLPHGAAKRLIGALAHPQNAPEIDKSGRLTGHALIAPRVEHTATGAAKTSFSRLFSGNAGLDSYSSAVSEFFFDVFGEGNYCGKGIYDVKAFSAVLAGRIKDERVLSHDLLEGCYAKAGFVSDIAVYDDHPARYLPFMRREHRWIRGDWQLLPFIFGKSGLNALSRYKMMDNLRRSLVMPTAAMVLLFVPLVEGAWAYSLIALLSICLSYLVDMFRDALRTRDAVARLFDSYESVKLAAAKLVFKLSVLPYEAWVALSAIGVSLWRTLVSHKNMLQWVTAAQADRTAERSVAGYYRAMLSGPVAGTILAVLSIPNGAWISLALSALWWVGPYAASFLSRPAQGARIKEEDRAYLHEIARQSYAFFAENSANGIPPDNIQIYPKTAPKEHTSPTNIGMALIAPLCAFFLGVIQEDELRKRTDSTLSAIENAEKWYGHLYNWMDINSLRPIPPLFVSSVDSGNLAASLLVLQGHFKDELGERAKRVLSEMDFSKLFDDEVKLFSIGMDCKSGKLTNSHYDLLASEARLLSFVTIAIGAVDASHWFRLARPLTAIDGRRLLISWSGTMFEYLLPVIYTGSVKNTLLGESMVNAVAVQRSAAKGTPWGVSESGYYAFDLAMNYQYRAFGVEGAGVRPTREERVVAPYASVLAAMEEPQAAVDNLRAMEELGARGKYGFYEALDFTPERVGNGRRLVMSFMAHHVGMTLAAITNALCDGAIVKAFMSVPGVEAASLLLEEKLPDRTVIMRKYSRALPKKSSGSYDELAPLCAVGEGAYPEFCFLTGGASIAACTDGRAKMTFKLGKDRVLFCPFEEDNARGEPSAAIFVNGRPTFGDAMISAHSIAFNQKRDGLAIKTELMAPPDENAALWLVTLKNESEAEKKAEIFAYAAVALTTVEESRAHKAFHKLFITAERPDHNTLCFTKNDRSSEKRTALWARLLWDGQVDAATDRYDCVGRGNGIKKPAFLIQGVPKSGVRRTPLEPCALFRAETAIPPGRTKTLAFVLAAGDEAEAKRSIGAYTSIVDALDALEACAMYARVRLKYLGLDGERANALRKKLSALLFPSVPGPDRLRALSSNALGKRALWRLGISGELPIALAEVEVAKDYPKARQLAELCRYASLYGEEIDAVFISNEPAGYGKPVAEELARISCGLGRAKVFSRQDLSDDEIQLLRALDSSSNKRPKKREKRKRPPLGQHALAIKTPRLAHFNGIGGFDGQDYVMRLKDRLTPVPWSNVLAQEGFGAIVTESGGGFTWAKNSALFKLTPHSNDPVDGRNGETFAIRDDETGAVYSPTPNGQGEYLVRHGYGFTEFTCGKESLYTRLTAFVSKGAKCWKLDLTNPMDRKRELSVYFCAEWVLGQSVADRTLCAWESEGVLLCRTGGEKGVAYAYLKGAEWTCSREEFFGRNAAQFGAELQKQPGGGNDACAGFRKRVSIEPGETVGLSVVIGFEEGEADALLAAKAFEPEIELNNVRQFWKEKLGRLKIKTGDDAFNRMMNGWLLYQVYASRLFSRAGWWQTGGAFGFRDQLQDVLALIEIDPARVREHLLLCAAHQYESGDVQHWWHPPYTGVRTRITDDRLFLPFVAAQYAKATGDDGVFDEAVPYLKDVPFPENRHDVYHEAEPSEQTGTLREHCLKAIYASFQTGEHGLPLMGTGDWNDGMDTIGNKGRGESLWLGWFTVAVIDVFLPYCEGEDKKALKRKAEELRVALDKHGWDGEWYRRAYFDDGSPLGSKENTECRIDLISQAWSVLAGGPKKRTQAALAAARKLLVDRQTGIIKLLDPPLENQLPRAGYIQSYARGLRENGGQYTHAAAWWILALLENGDKEEAAELYSMINPIRHSDNPIISAVYRGEPYVMAGDVYDGDWPGRAGWTWYTGSAAWMYRAGLALIGLHKEGNRVWLCGGAERFADCEAEFDGKRVERIEGGVIQ